MITPQTIREKYNNFKVALNAQVDLINSYTDLSSADKLREIDIWDKRNSPYWAAKIAEVKTHIRLLAS